MRPIFKQLDLPEYKQNLNEALTYLNNLSYSVVKTKYNAKGNWDAVSIRGYSDDISNILKPGVLESNVEEQPLRWTHLYEQPELLSIKEILTFIPAEFERVRIMRLKSGTRISKHTDKVDKSIKDGKIVRLHVPLKTNSNVTFTLWEGNNSNTYNLETGKYYYVDVSKPHAVDNSADFDRLHLVIDCFNNPKLENLLKQDVIS
jgi:hypothetical protein